MKSNVLQFQEAIQILLVLFLFTFSSIIPFLWVFRIFNSRYEVYLKLCCAIICFIIFLYRIIIERRNLKLAQIEVLANLLLIVTILGKIILGLSNLIDYLHPAVFTLNILAISSILKLNQNHRTLFKFVFIWQLIILLSQLLFILSVTPIIQNIKNITQYTYVEILPSSSYSPNKAGIIFLTGAVCSLFMYNFSNKNKTPINLLFFIPLAIFALFIVVSGSRASMLGLIASVTLFAIIKFYNVIITGSADEIQYLKKQFCILTAIISAVMIILLYTGILHNFLSKFNHGFSFRDTIWITFLKEQFDSFPSLNFFFGYGYHQFKNPFWQQHHGMHNFFLEIWGRNGFISAVFFVVIIIHALKNYIQKNNFHVNISFLAAFIFLNLFEANLYTKIFTIDNQLFFFIALMGYYEKIKATEKIENCGVIN